MGAYEKSKKHFDSTARSYDSSFDGKFVAPMYAHILQMLEGLSGRILDVGCGNGNILAALNTKVWEPYGVDLSEEMVKVASERLSGKAKIYVADSSHLPFDNQYFNVLICNASFHHYMNAREVLLEMKRVLCPGGLLVIGEGYAFQPFRALLNLSFKFMNTGDVHSYGQNELKRLVERSGFENVNVERLGTRMFLKGIASHGSEKRGVVV